MPEEAGSRATFGCGATGYAVTHGPVPSEGLTLSSVWHYLKLFQSDVCGGDISTTVVTVLCKPEHDERPTLLCAVARVQYERDLINIVAMFKLFKPMLAQCRQITTGI